MLAFLSSSREVAVSIPGWGVVIWRLSLLPERLTFAFPAFFFFFSFGMTLYELSCKSFHQKSRFQIRPWGNTMNAPRLKFPELPLFFISNTKTCSNLFKLSLLNPLFFFHFPVSAKKKKREAQNIWEEDKRRKKIFEFLLKKHKIFMIFSPPPACTWNMIFFPLI